MTMTVGTIERASEVKAIITTSTRRTRRGAGVEKDLAMTEIVTGTAMVMVVVVVVEAEV